MLKPAVDKLRGLDGEGNATAGANLKAVQTMLVHKSAALTLDTHADLFPDDLEAVAEAMDTAHQKFRESTVDVLRTGLAGNN